MLARHNVLSKLIGMRRGPDQSGGFEERLRKRLRARGRWHGGELGGRPRDEADRPPYFRRRPVRGQALLFSRARTREK